MYVPMLAVMVLFVWWFIVRPANLAARERQVQLQRERERLRQVEEQKQALAKLETFRWDGERLHSELSAQYIEVHFPTMRMRMGTDESIYGRGESTDYEVRRKPDGMWEYRLTREMQSRNLRFLNELLPKAEQFEGLPETERSSAWMDEETHDLIEDTSVAAVAQAIERTEKNEWLSFDVHDALREVTPQIEFQYMRCVMRPA